MDKLRYDGESQLALMLERENAPSLLLRREASHPRRDSKSEHGTGSVKKSTLKNSSLARRGRGGEDGAKTKQVTFSAVMPRRHNNVIRDGENMQLTSQFEQLPNSANEETLRDPRHRSRSFESRNLYYLQNPIVMQISEKLDRLGEERYSLNCN